MYVVYKHTAPNGKSYIGLTSQTLKRRFRDGEGYKGCPVFYKAIQKYGWCSFTHEILADNLTFDKACELEQFYIAQYKSLTSQNGYNLENGGRVGHKMSDESKLKLSRSITGRKMGPHKEETKRKISEAHKGLKRPPKSPETCRKLSEALKGRTFSKEHCQHISESKRGLFTGKNNPRARKVLCVETGVVFDTVKDAGKFKNGSPKNIISCCRGRLKTSGGYHWRYVEEV